ncbi:hypothetical protein F5B19DRAFT_224072 [Rostrohypoxylon terebratum]|nr:hypothetical protein F5B19DRAFT_224072 [Rostrohypoxylon terebratum]
MCFSDSYSERQENQRPVTAYAREAPRSYGQRPQTAHHDTMRGYGNSSTFRVGVSLDHPGPSHRQPSQDPRRVWNPEYSQRPRPPPQSYAQQYDQNQQLPPDAYLREVPVASPRVTQGYDAARQHSVHGQFGYEPPRQARPAPTSYASTSQRETVRPPQPRHPSGLKPASRPMRPELVTSVSQPGRLVRRDSNGISECSDDEELDLKDLRGYTVSPCPPSPPAKDRPSISRGASNRPRKPKRLFGDDPLRLGTWVEIGQGKFYPSSMGTWSLMFAWEPEWRGVKEKLYVLIGRICFFLIRLIILCRRP